MTLTWLKTKKGAEVKKVPLILVLAVAIFVL
jgi:hypothetical protein